MFLSHGIATESYSKTPCSFPPREWWVLPPVHCQLLHIVVSLQQLPDANFLLTPVCSMNIFVPFHVTAVLFLPIFLSEMEPESVWIYPLYIYIYIHTVKPVKLTTFIRWPPTEVDHISVEPAKSYIVCIYDHLCNFSTFMCWIPVSVSHAKWNRSTVYTCLYWPW